MELVMRLAGRGLSSGQDERERMTAQAVERSEKTIARRSSSDTVLADIRSSTSELRRSAAKAGVRLGR